MDNNKLIKPVVWVAPPERVYNYGMLDANHQIHPDVQVISVDVFAQIRHQYGLGHIPPSENLVLVRNPFEQDKYCELSENLEFEFYDSKLHYIELVCKNIGAKKFNCTYQNVKTMQRERKGKTGTTIKYVTLKGGFVSKTEERLKNELHLSSEWNSEQQFDKAKALAEEHNLMNDPTIKAFLSDATNHKSYSKSVVVTQEVNNLFDIAFTLGGLEFFKFFDLKYRNYVEYRHEVSVNINVEF